MDALDVLCAQLTCDLFTIAKFLVVLAVNDCFMTQSPDLKKNNNTCNGRPTLSSVVFSRE